MTLVRLEPAAPRSRVKHSTTVLPNRLKVCINMKWRCIAFGSFPFLLGNTQTAGKFKFPQLAFHDKHLVLSWNIESGCSKVFCKL